MSRNAKIYLATLMAVVITILSVMLYPTEYYIIGIFFSILGWFWIASFIQSNIDLLVDVAMGQKKLPRISAKGDGAISKQNFLKIIAQISRIRSHEATV